MAFTPDAISNHVYKTPEGRRYIVKEHNNNEVVVVRINNENSEESSEITWNEVQWNSKHLVDESVGGGTPPPVDEEDDDDYMEEPDGQEYMFVYNSVDKKLYVKDRQGNVVTQFDVMSADGLDAYQLWKSKQKKGTDTSWEAFLKVFQGKDGDDGDEGKSAYEIWKKVTNPPEGKDREIDFIKSLRGEDGHNAKDGKSAYDIWKETTNPPKGEDSPIDFLNYLRGKDGDNGKDAYELWIELGGKGDKQAFLKWLASKVETQKGENGATYIPHIENGELFFVNDITGEKTNPRPIYGKDGKTYYPHIDGYELYYTEDKEGKGPEVLPRVNLRGKQGRTFTPKFDGTKLHFEDGEGEETKTVELRGKNAYELWVEEGHPGATYEDFKKFFAGRVVNKKYGYKDIKDWTAPVQHINRHLLTDSDTIDAGLNAEQYYLYRQEQIEEIREEGRAKRGNWFQEVFWWCSGADTSVLRTCPGDYSKYVGIGTVIFFTALMAFFSSFTAMQLVFNEYDKQEFPLSGLFAIPFIIAGIAIIIHYGIKRTIERKVIVNETKKKVTNKATVVNFDKRAIIIGALLILTPILLHLFWNDQPKIETVNGIAAIFAMFWAAMIFFLDRFITNTMYSDGKTTISWLEFRSALPRIIISIFLGIVISAPLELRIFDPEIKEYIAEKKIDKDEEYKDAIAKLENEKSKINNRLTTFWSQNIPNRDDKRYNHKWTGEIEKVKKPTVKTISPKDGPSYQIESFILVYDSVFGFDKEKFDAEYQNFVESYQNEKDSVYEEQKRLAQSFETLKKNTKDRLYDEYKKGKKASGLYERLTALHAIAMKEGQPDGYSPLFVDKGVSGTNTFVNDSVNSAPRGSDSVTVSDRILSTTIKNDSAGVASMSKDSTGLTASVKSDSAQYENSKLNNANTNVKSAWALSADSVAKVVIAIVLFLIFSVISFKNNKGFLDSLKEKRNIIAIILSFVFSIILALNYEMVHYLWYYLTTPIGLIMLLFILIDVSPVFYKMMLADGRYDKIISQDKKIEEDLIRIRVAKSLHKVNESELSSLSPFIFGNTYEKIKNILTNKNTEGRKAIELYDPNDEESKSIAHKNKELFEKVLGMKYRIAYASYSAWYKNMYDLNLGYEEIDEEHIDSPEEIKDKFVVMFRSAPEVGGNVVVENELGTYSPDSVVGVEAVPNEGFDFIGWRDDETAPSKRDITVTEDKIYVALFKRTTKAD